MGDKIYVKDQSFKSQWTRIGASTGEQLERAQTAVANAGTGFLPNWDLVCDRILREWTSISQFTADELSRLASEDLPLYAYHRFRYDKYPEEHTLDAMPPCTQIEVSSACNFRCTFCFQTNPLLTSRRQGHMGYMDHALFRDLLMMLEGSTEFITLASRGEPLLCPGIGRMLEECPTSPLGLKLNTNASLLDERLSHAILSGAVRTLVFSVDAADEPTYSQHRVGGSLERVKRNIEQFERIRQKHYPGSAIITRISGVLYDESQQSLPQMVATWGEWVDQIAFVRYNPWENVYEADRNRIVAPCTDLWRRMFIWHDGSVNPCDTDYLSKLSIGNVEKGTISQIWGGMEYERLRSQHLAGERHAISPCSRCTYV